MEWSWTDVESGLTSPSLKDLTPPPLGYTWDDPRMVEEVQVYLDAPLVITTEVTTEGMTGAMTATMRETTTGHTGDDRPLHTTAGGEHTGPGPDHDPTHHVGTEY